MGDWYFVISSGEDSISVERLSKEELLKRLKEDYYGPTGDIIGDLPDESDPMCWGNQLVVIKGNVVVPTEKTTVTDWAVG
jgi:hypothetical protein